MFFNATKKPETPTPRLKRYPDRERGSETLVVIDPTDSSQTIVPEPNQLLTLEASGAARTFLFDRWNGKANICAVCEVVNGGDGYKKEVCDHMMCVVNGVRGVEYVEEDGKWTPANPLRRLVNPFPSIERPEPPKPEQPKEEPPKTIEQTVDKRVQWETALRELEERSRAELVVADNLKREAKRHEKAAKNLRDKILELLSDGSENYSSETPLFDGLPEED